MAKPVLVLSTLSIITAISLGQDAGSVSCPGNVRGEVGTDIVVPCNISGAIELVYWFKDVRTENDLPILSLEEGEFGGTEYGRGTFELRGDGAMVINNAQRGHEDTYTMKVYFHDGASSTSSTKISVYIRPLRSCPSIDSCDPTCKQCDLESSNDGVLTCSVGGARPKLNISWKIIQQSNLNFFERQPVYTEWDEKYNSSVSIAYNLAECGAYAVLKCAALNAIYMLEEATVTIQSASCVSASPNQPQNTTSSPAKIKDQRGAPVTLTAILVIVGIILVLGFGLGLVLLALRRYGRVRSCSHPTGHNRATLVQKLVTRYMDEVCIEPECHAGGQRTYKNCECIYVQPGGSTRVGTVKDLYRGQFRKANDRVLIIARRGYGKQTTTKKLLVDWSKSKHEYLLLYIPMAKLTQGRNLFEMLRELYAPDVSDLTVDDIEDICKRNECLVLLGDLEELKQSNLGSKESEGLLDTLSFENLLEGEIADIYKPIKVWATSRENEDRISLFKAPCTKATIQGVIDTPV